MHPSRSPLLCAAAAVVVAGCGVAASDVAPGYTSVDSTAVGASINKWATSIVARDFDAWATSVGPGVILYPPNAKPVVGREAAVAYVRNYPVITKFDVVVEEQWGRQDVAYARGAYTLTLRLPDSAVVNDTGSFVGTFRRQPDATWAHDRVMWNSNLPIAPPPPASPRD